MDDKLKPGLNQGAGLGTRVVWGGEQVQHPYNATQTPIVVSAAYGYHDIDEWYDVALGKQPGFIYSRMSNPTVSVLEDKLCELESAESAVAFSTGMAAISGVLHTFLACGQRVVSTRDSYGGTNKIFEEFLPRMGVEVTLCDTLDIDAIEHQIAKGCNVLYLETPTNPTLKVLDIRRLVAAAKSVGALVIADNTFATPLNQNPLALGVDVVVHSATKFLSGHGDVLGGVVCGSEQLMSQVRHYREINGASLDPFSAYLIIRGIKTLALRLRQQQTSAQALAEYLCSEPLVAEGAVVLCGHRRQMGCYAPTVLEGVSHDSRIWQQEVFAPVVILEPFDQLEDAVALANAPEYSLHAGLFTRDLSKALKLARQIEAGGVMINDSSDYRFDAMPFGGFKYGSLGREGVRFAYEDMTQPKVVCINDMG